ncbi:HlyD family efflux transporter periplasmic adaptor subunit [Roseiconus lacunae]|uniref:HlyD family efflux transporter periplasmic adaptor subunit n=1 Tax=Roseiconus lacunae TaxID=2605694 RepID=UPI0030850C4A|nr:HlyD family efflux transporter periplasmic adaptor subunit [Stieleria sp. HD01]
MTNQLKSRPEHAQQEWSEIEAFVAGVTDLSRQPQSLAEFASNAIERTVELLDAIGGCIWLANSDGQFTNVGGSLSQNEEASLLSIENKSHLQFLEQTVSLGRVATKTAIRCDGKADLDSRGLLWIAAPCRIDDQTDAVVEVLQYAGLGTDAQLGHERLLSIVGQLTEAFAQRSKAREQDASLSMRQQREAFLREIHRSVDLNETVFRIVNEGRLLIGCDRLSLAVYRRNRLRVIAISGIDVIDRNSPLVATMARLLDAVGRSRHWLRYRASTDSLPPQLQEPIESYINQSNTEAFDAVPLIRDQASDALSDATVAKPSPDCIGVLLVEHFRGGDAPGLDDRISSIATLSTPALINSLAVDSLPLLGLAKRLRRAGDWAADSRLRLVIAVAVTITVCVALFTVPTTFYVRAKGEAVPKQRRHVFAPLDGEVVRMNFQKDHEVERGQPLIDLRNRSLELDLQRLNGDFRATEKRRLAIASARVQRTKQTDDRDQLQRNYAVDLAAEEQELSQQLESLEKQIALLQQQMNQLTIVSPLSGHLLTWDAKTLLADRPVVRGQRLLTVAKLDGEWQIEIKIPEREFGNLIQAYEIGSPLTVRCTTSDGAANAFEGALIDVSRRADVDVSGNVHSLARVSVPVRATHWLRPGMQLHCKIDCGERSVGYVWFHEIYETTRSWLAW